MEIKIDSNSSVNYKDNSVGAQKNSSTSFLDALTEASSNISNTNTESNKNTTEVKDTFQTGNVIIDNLPDRNKGEVLKAIKKLNDIFHIDILGNPDQFCKKDSTINITRILDSYGNRVTQSDLQDLSKAINTLRDNGLISDEDYFYALKWIETKQQYFKIKMQNEKNKGLIGDLILKHKKIIKILKINP